MKEIGWVEPQLMFYDNYIDFQECVMGVLTEKYVKDEYFKTDKYKMDDICELCIRHPNFTGKLIMVLYENLMEAKGSEKQ